jgi:hypothetical protein
MRTLLICHEDGGRFYTPLVRLLLERRESGLFRSGKHGEPAPP